jgi:hypothetical protein
MEMVVIVMNYVVALVIVVLIKDQFVMDVVMELS